jgi:hypothetical protein
MSFEWNGGGYITGSATHLRFSVPLGRLVDTQNTKV